MWIRWVEVRGLRDLPAHRFALEPGCARVCGPDPESTALFDALELAFDVIAGLPPLRLLAALGACGPRELDPFGSAEEVDDLVPAGLRDWLAPGQQSLTVTLSLGLDPALFSGLRAAAAADPRVALALAAEPTVGVAVGALATTDHRSLALSLQRVDVGAEALWSTGAERPRWLRWLLSAIGGRVLRAPGPDPLGALRTAQRGRDGYAAYARWTGALGPGGPRLRLAEDPAGRPLLLGDELPLRRFGEAAERRAALAAAAALSGADVLLVEGEDDLLDAFLSGEGASLEQALCAAGGPPPAALAAPPPTRGPKTLRFPGGLA